MKKLIIYSLVAIVGWNYYQKNIALRQSETYSETQMFQTTTTTNTQAVGNFSCDGREYCSQMQSRAEAEYFLRNCPNTKMDGDHDGMPCENDSRF